MKKLRELVLFVNEHDFKSALLKKTGSGAPTRLQVFYDGILQNKWGTDEEALQELYPDDPSSASYRKLKSDLKDRMLDAILSLRFEGNKYNGYQRAYFRSYKEWAAIKILMSHGTGETAADLATRLLKQVQQYEFTALAQDITSMLRLHFGARMGDMDKFEQFNQQYKALQEVLQWEGLAEEHYILLSSAYIHAKGTREDITDLSRQLFETLRPGLEKFKTYRLYFYTALIELASYTSVHQYAAALQVCKKYIDHFMEKQYEAHVPLQVLHYQELLCHIQLKNYTDGHASAVNCARLVKEGSFNWFKFQESLFILSMHTGEYQAAYQVFNAITRHKYFDHLPDSAREMWTIFGAYLAFLLQTGKIKPDTKDKLKSLRASRFQNDTPLFSKDKKGMNIPILIGQLLLLLAEGKKSAYIDKIESLEQYNYKYLRNKYNMRNHYFIKILLKIPLAGFNKENLKEKTKELLHSLKGTPGSSVFQNSIFEIIPYETLYEIVLEHLI